MVLNRLKVLVHTSKPPLEAGFGVQVALLLLRFQSPEVKISAVPLDSVAAVCAQSSQSSNQLLYSLFVRPIRPLQAALGCKPNC